jgi:hypothetical protein
MNHSDGELTISQRTKSAILKIKFIDKDMNGFFSLDDVHGQVKAGEKAATFTGHAFNQCLHVSIVVELDSQYLTFEITVDWEKWEGIDIRQLPYFNKINDLFASFDNDNILELLIEMEGNAIFHESQTISTELIENTTITKRFLNYLDSARVIASTVEKNILFFADKVSCSKKEYDAVLSEASIIRNLQEYKQHEINLPVECSFILDKDRKNLDLINHNDDGMIKISSSDIDVKILDQLVRLPTKVIVLKGIKSIFPNDITQLEIGDSFKVHWHATRDFSCTMEYL